MNVKTIDARQLERISEDGRCVVVDVRTTAEVRGQWLEDSIHMPLQDLHVGKLREQLSVVGCADGEAVYLLCASGQRANLAAGKLNGQLENPLYVIEGGIEALKGTRLPLQRSEHQVMSLERQVRIAAGSLVVVGVVLGATVTPWAYGLSAFVGAGLTFAGITNTCAMGMMLARMPWNQA